MACFNAKFVEDDEENSFFSADEGTDESNEESNDESDLAENEEFKTKPKDEDRQNTVKANEDLEFVDSTRSESDINSRVVLNAQASVDSDNKLDDWDTENWDPINYDSNKIDKNVVVQVLKSCKRSLSPCTEQSAEEPNTKEEGIIGHNSHQSNSWFDGWNTIFSAASDSIHTIKNTVGEGLTTVLETVETSLGAPSPEDLLRMSLEEKEQLSKKADEVKEPLPMNESDDCDSAEEYAIETGSSNVDRRCIKDDKSFGSLSDSVLVQEHDNHVQSASTSLLSNMSQLIECTGRSLITSSLDVMENIGKKTFDILTEPVTSSSHIDENDPNSTSIGNQRRKLRFQTENPNLSAVLKEAKLKSDQIGDDWTKLSLEEKHKPSFDRCFEKSGGSVSLDALKMLSTNQQEQFDSILKSLSRGRREALKRGIDYSIEQFNEIISVENNDDDDEPDFESDFLEIWDSIDIHAFKCNRVLDVHAGFSKEIDKIRLKTLELSDVERIYGHCIEFFGEFAAATVEILLKLSQILLVEKRAPAFTEFAKLSKCIIVEIDSVASKCSLLLKNCMNDDSKEKIASVVADLLLENDDSKEKIASVVADLLLEAHNTSLCIQDASRLMLPILSILYVESRLK